MESYLAALKINGNLKPLGVCIRMANGDEPIDMYIHTWRREKHQCAVKKKFGISDAWPLI